jgi:hypothetical protein
MMQDALPSESAKALPTETTPRTVTGAVVSVEVMLYIALIAFTLILRLAELDNVPMTHAESAQALSAWRAIQPDAPLDPTVTASPLLFALQSISLGLLGGSEVAARIMTVFGCVLLVVTPVLFRAWLGRSRALILSLLLSFSPVLFAASRYSSPAVWSVLLVVIGLWALWSFTREQRTSYGVGAVVAFGCAALLTEAGGLVLLIILIGAGVITGLTARGDNDTYRFEEDDTDTNSAATASFVSVFRSLPLASGAAIAALTVIVISTAFMVHPDGLSSVGELIGTFLRRFTEATPNAPALFPLVTSIFYEPFIWAFAAAGVIIASQSGRMDTVTRFSLAWVLMASIAAGLFRGANADHAVWFVVPLTVLASRAVIALFSHDRSDDVLRVPSWARWVVALAMLAIIAVFTLAFQEASRLIVFNGDGSLAALERDSTVIVLMLIPLLFTVITFFLVASAWNDRAALQGMGLGVLIFMLVSSMGSGWRIAVEGADRPNELWHTAVITRDTFLLRETLNEIAQRASGGFPEVEIAAVAGADSTVAWLLRDFRNTRFVSDVTETFGAPVIIMPTTGDDIPGEISTAYVGQDFIVERQWSIDTLQWTEIAAWWSQRVTRFADTSIVRFIVWVRGDVYDSGDFIEDATG